jgi:glycerophosphoryl diester phosphodiesterase
MPIVSTATDAAIRAAWGRVWLLWRPMAAWTILVWAAITLLLVPLSSGVLGRYLLRGERLVVGNEALLAWLVTPAGFGYALLAGALAITAAVVRYAGIFRIVTDHLEGHRANVRKTAFRLWPQLPFLFKLCVAAIALGGLLVLPLAASLAAIHATFLAAHDINYYLSTTPPAWWAALALAGVIGFAWLLAASYLIGRLLPALPAYLDGHRPLTAAVRRAWALADGRTARLVRLLAFCLGVWIGTRLVVGLGFLAAASAGLDRIAAGTASLQLLAAISATYLGASLILDAAINFVGFSFIATVLTKFYYEDTPLHAEALPAPRIRDLPFHAAAKVLRWLSPIRLGLIALLLVGAGLMGGRLLLGGVEAPRGVVVHAHRGGPPPSPENTLAALERSIAAAADYAEIDVQRTRDGEIVVVHDADLMRVARDRRRIADVTYAEIAGVVQLPDDGSPASERRVATLGDFLERARGRIGLNIELKYYGWDPALAPAVVEEVRRHGMEGEILLMSLERRAVEDLRRMASEMPVGYVAAAAVGELSRLPVSFLALATPLATPRLIRNARAAGTEVHVWTINRADAMADLIERGVDGIITDDPALAVSVREELRQMSPAARLLLRVARF